MKLLRAILQFCSDEEGVGSIYMLALLPLFLILAGFGMDGTAAFRTRDMLQSTADSSALAAALSLPSSGHATSTQETAAVTSARNYAQLNMSVAGFGNVLNTNAATNGDVTFGFWDGSSFTTPAPVGAAENAVRVTVKTATANSNAYPTSFLALMGKSSWDIAAAATAWVGYPPVCLFVKTSFDNSGGPKTNLSGCTIGSNGSLDCHGHDTQADFGIAHTTNNGCGVRKLSGQPQIPDPYDALKSNIPADPCAGAYPGQAINSTPTLTSSPLVICGDMNLNVNITLAPASGGSVIVIENGALNTNGNTINTSNTNGLTIIFSGTAGAGYNHAITGTGTLDFDGPPSGVWQNMVVYQDPVLTANLWDPGQTPSKNLTMNLSGIMYMPNADIVVHGNVGDASSNCLVLVANSVTTKGTGYILAQKACNNAPRVVQPLSQLVQ